MGKDTKPEKKDKKRKADEVEDVEMAEVTEVRNSASIFPNLYLPVQQSPKKSKKEKKEKEEVVIPVEDLSPVAHPFAEKKLVKKLHKTIKKGMDFQRR